MVRFRCVSLRIVMPGTGKMVRTVVMGSVAAMVACASWLIYASGGLLAVIVTLCAFFPVPDPAPPEAVEGTVVAVAMVAAVAMASRLRGC